MKKPDIEDILKQINNLKKPDSEPREKVIEKGADSFRDLLNDVSEEIQRVLDENDFTQEDLCRLTNMSQSNISKILNGKVVPRLETLQKIAEATNTRLIISFENLEGEE